MSTQLITGLVPVATALVGLTAGLASPFITGGVSRRNSRRGDQLARCDEILSMFRDVNVIDTLRDPTNGTRRGLLLAAVRIRDKRARAACTSLVEYSSRADATDNGILDHWTTMIGEVARVYRSAG